MAEEWQFRTAQVFKTFANPVEDTVLDWIKRRDAKSNGGDTIDASTLRDSLCNRDATAEDFNAFLSTAAPHALTGANLSRLRATFLIDAYDSILQSGQKPQTDREAVREASRVIPLPSKHYTWPRSSLLSKCLRRQTSRHCLKGLRRGSVPTMISVYGVDNLAMLRLCR